MASNTSREHRWRKKLFKKRGDEPAETATPTTVFGLGALPERLKAGAVSSPPGADPAPSGADPTPHGADPAPPASSGGGVLTKARAADPVEPDIDLWERAYRKLKDDPETKKLMIAYHEILKSLPKDERPVGIKGPKEEMSAVVAKKLKFFNTHQWEVSLGKVTVNVQKQIEHIVNVIKVVKDFGSSVAGLDPVHAGLPWAGVCLLLTLVTSDSDQHAAVIKGLDQITSTIPVYSAYETSIDKGNHPPKVVKDVEDQLILLYSLILKYQANAVCFFGRHTFKRFLLNTFPSVSWTDSSKDIEVAASQCDRFLNSLNLKNVRDVLQRQSKDIEKLLDDFRHNASLRDRILTWASNVPNWEDHEFVRAKLGKQYWGSGKWLFQSNAFVKWESAPSGVFWLRGAVGTGKSSLTSLVIQRQLSGDSPERQAYFYCSRDPQRSGRGDAHHILRSLVAQLSCTQLDPIKNKWETKQQGRGALTLEDCTALMIELTRSKGTYTIVIDALDECSDPFELVEGLNIISQSSQNIRIFFSSRLQDHITPEFPFALVVEIDRKEDRGDITKFIEEECRERRKVIRHRYPGPEQMTDDLAETLQRLLSDRAGSMFRWVELQLDLFLVKRKPLHRSKIQARLEALEASAALPDLNEVYSQVYEMNTEGGYEEYAAKALKWVLCSFEPLSIDALVSAVAVTVDSGYDETATRESILNRFCSNFIVIDEANMVRFAHVSVKEYLEKTRSEYSSQLCHAQAAVSCLGYLLRPELDSAVSEAEMPQFEEYAHICWPSHCEEARDSRKSGALLRLFGDFLLNSKPDSPYVGWAEWVEQVQDNHEYGALIQRLMDALETPTPLLLACTFGFEETLEIFESRLSDEDLVKCREQGLYLASSYSQAIVIDYIIRSGTDINALGGREGTAIHVAAHHGHSPIVQKLLENGADMDARNEDGNTALQLAASGCKQSVVELLLNEGADLIVKANDGATVLHEATRGWVKEAEIKIIQMLLDKGADIAAKDVKGSTALHEASKWAKEEDVRLLLEKGADIAGRNNEGSTALHLAASSSRRSEGTVQLLLDEGADIEARNNKGSTALHLVASKGGESIVRFLLQNGADTEAGNNEGYTALHLAVSSHWGRANKVKALLQNGADIAVRNNGGDTALHFAIRRQVLETVRLLLEYGADIMAKGADGRTALELAEGGGSLDLEDGESMWDSDYSVSEEELEDGESVEESEDGEHAEELDDRESAGGSEDLVSAGELSMEDLREIEKRARKPEKILALLQKKAEENKNREEGRDKV